MDLFNPRTIVDLRHAENPYLTRTNKHIIAILVPEIQIHAWAILHYVPQSKVVLTGTLVIQIT